jgi:hypothetical protein
MRKNHRAFKYRRPIKANGNLRSIDEKMSVIIRCNFPYAMLKVETNNGV